MQKMRLLLIVNPKISAARQQRMCTCVCQFLGAVAPLSFFLHEGFNSCVEQWTMHLIGVFKFLKFASEMSLTDVANRTSAALLELTTPTPYRPPSTGRGLHVNILKTQSSPPS